MKCVGIDIFFVSNEFPALDAKLAGLELIQITNRGSKVWPGKCPPIELTDLYTARYKKSDSSEVQSHEALSVLAEFSKKWNWVHVEKLLQINNSDRFA